MGALCRDDRISPRSSHVLGFLPPSGSPWLRGCRTQLWSVLPGGSVLVSLLLQMRAFYRQGTHMWLCCILQRTRFNSGPSNTCLGLTAVRKARDLATCSAVCSGFFGLPFCKLFFFLPSLTIKSFRSLGQKCSKQSKNSSIQIPLFGNVEYEGSEHLV